MNARDIDIYMFHTLLTIVHTVCHRSFPLSSKIYNLMVFLYRDDEKIKPDDRVTSSLDDLAARLSISNLESADTGVYTCVARCESGITRCSTELCVFDTKPATDSYLQPPIFVEGLVPKRTADEGEPVQLTVRLQGETTVHNVMIVIIRYRCS